MFLREFSNTVPRYSEQSKDNESADRHDNEEDDSVMRFNDVRKTKLTLEHLSKIRRMNDVRQYELSVMRKNIEAQYGSAGSEDDGL